jgi:hypothetical protein
MQGTGSLRTRRLLGLAVLVSAALAAAPASAATLPFDNWTVSGTLTIKKLQQSVSFPPGSAFNGSSDLTAGTLTGHVTVPTFTAHLKVLGLPVDATLELIEAAPVSGTVKLGGAFVAISSTSSFYIRIRRLASPLLPLNLVASRCQTSSPVTLALLYWDRLDLAKGFRFTGTTTIPPLTGCGATTPLLNSLMAGPGNAFDVKLAPPA